jgi:hypothetical protein
MPISLPAFTGVIASNLLGAALIGVEIPRLASGVATGLVYWAPQIVVSTIDTGTAGAGVNVPLPWLIPQPLLFGLLSANVPPAGFVGLFVPSMVAGLSNGLSVSFLQMLISTTHPTVGTGTGIAKFTAPPAAISMLAGFASVGLVGEAAPRLATAIGVSLDASIANLVIPVVIVGPPSPSPASGTGIGKLI